MGNLIKVILLIVVADSITSTIGANILVTLTIPVASSHTKSMSPLSEALTRRGHNVTLLTSSEAGLSGFEPGTYTSALHYNFNDPSSIEEVNLDIQRLAFENSVVLKIRTLKRAFALTMQGCRCLFDDDTTLSKLRESKFDMVVGDSFDGCDAILASYLDAPHIAVTTSMRYPFFHEHIFGIPFPSSYGPFGLFPLSDRMSFSERILSFIEHHVIIEGFGRYHFMGMNAIKDSHGIAPGRRVQDLLAGAELWLCVTNFAFDFPRPTAPNWIAIGGIINVPTKPLSEEYEEFIAGAGEHGFVVFSLGTYFPTLPDPSMTGAFAKAFSELPQRVIWRYTGPRPKHLGNNTKLAKWLPQSDLLAHPRARLLIYHGGINGILEAIYHAVPMVIMPVLAEQEANAKKVEVRGMGRRLQKDAITYEAVRDAIDDVLENPRYKENLVRYSAMYQDTQSKPDQTAVFWIEHVLKFGGSHLRLRANELNLMQLHSIDVMAFLLTISLIVLFLLVSGCRRCLKLCCSSNAKTKVE